MQHTPPQLFWLLPPSLAHSLRLANGKEWSVYFGSSQRAHSFPVWFCTLGQMTVVVHGRRLFTSRETGSREGIQEGAVVGCRSKGILPITYFVWKLPQPPTLVGYQGWAHETERRGNIPNSNWNAWVKILTLPPPRFLFLSFFKNFISFFG